MKFTRTFLAAALATAAFGCGDDPAPSNPDAKVTPTIDAAPGTPDAVQGQIIEIVAGDITADTTWSAINTYVLKGHVFVTGGTLTIEAGTLIKGETGSSLVITTTGKLNAVGTAAKPIVFTSADPAPAPGDWGGVVMLGTAPINVTGGTNKIEGFPDNGTLGTKNSYGGANAAHDCGKIKYARIEFAGFLLAVDNELNSLSLAGCGTATEVDYVETHAGADDGVEIFGGTVNVKHLVISQPDDDGLDYDLGWTGTAQYVVIIQNATTSDKAFEADNQNANNDATPRTSPEIWNVTIVGGGATAKGAGMHLRRGVAGKIRNAIITNFPKYAVNIDGFPTATQYNAGTLSLDYAIMNPPAAGALWPTGFDDKVVSSVTTSDDCQTPNTNCLDEAAKLGDAALHNQLNVDPMLTDPTNLTAPNVKPKAGSPALTGGATPTSGKGFDAAATFFGAVGTDDWTAGWTAFPALGA